MIKQLCGAAVFVFVLTAPCLAQETPARDLPANGGAGARTGNITATGKTVPNPGASQSSGTTSMDRGIEHEDNAIQSRICKGC